MTKVCRLCLTRLQRGSKYFNINAVESFTGFMPYRDQLTTCIPEMALDLIPSPVICNNCRTALKSSYDFKSRCLLVEKKIREYVESLPLETTNFDLSVIDTSELPKITRIATAAEVEQAATKQNNPQLRQGQKPTVGGKETSLLSNLLTLKKEEIFSSNSSETSPVSNSDYSASSFMVASRTKMNRASISPGGVSQKKSSPPKQFLCNHCNLEFPNVPALHSHKQMMHEEEFLCNFCNQPFRSLQNLRRHNNVCQKTSLAEHNPQLVNPILTKRPHLPMKAKNHLKKWLFKHTDHPYPTDVEKQQLMKETGLSLLQVENWFINARRRILGDLTKLKNMRGRGRQKTQPKMQADVDLDDNEDLEFDQDHTMSFEEPEEENEMPLSALEKLSDSFKMNMEDINSTEENGEEDSSTDTANSTFDNSAGSMLQISNVEGEAGQVEVDHQGIFRMRSRVEEQEGENGGDPLAENSEDVPETSLSTNVKMEIVEEEVCSKEKKVIPVKQELHSDIEDTDTASSE